MLDKPAGFFESAPLRLTLQPVVFDDAVTHGNTLVANVGSRVVALVRDRLANDVAMFQRAAMKNPCVAPYLLPLQFCML